MAFADALRSTTWTGTDVADLLEGIFVSGHPVTWTTWSPTYSGTGSLTFTTVTTNVAQYIQVGKLVICHLNATGTTGGVTNTTIQATLPVTAVDSNNRAGAAFITDSTDAVGQLFTSGTTLMGFRKYDSSNWGLGASRGIVGTLIYKAA